MWRHHPKIHLCAEALVSGNVVAYPTEAVWGLGCNPFNVRAVEQVLALKRRHWKKGLILVAGDISQVEFLLQDLPLPKWELLQHSWPGHVSWLIPHNNQIPKIVSGSHATVAVRVSSHPVIQALCHKFGGPIVSTSANPQGFPPATSQVSARRYFKSRGVCFSPGVVGKHSAPSAIKDLTTEKIIRQ